MLDRRLFGQVAASAAAFGLLASALPITAAKSAEPRKRILVFDVNQTLLDIQVLRPFFKRLFADEQVMQTWFANLIIYAETLTLAKGYADFGRLGGAVLNMIAETRNVQVKQDDLAELRTTMRTLPPHPEVPGALQRLKTAGFRLSVLVNNPLETVQAQLEHAGLAKYFDRLFSVDSVKQFKPAAAPYQFAASELGVATSDIRMVAAHTWDVIGALGAGCAAALIKRAGVAPLQAPDLSQPDIVGADLNTVASQIIERDTA